MPQLLKYKHVEQWTGGVQGIVIVKPDAPFGLPLSPDQWLYLFTLAIAVVMFVLGWNLIRGRVGRALVAIRDHPIAAAAMGIDTALYKSLAFGVSAMYTGVAGALGAIAVQFVAPDSFAVGLSIGFLVGIVIGGLASISGRVFGALFIQFVPNIADQISKAAPWAIYGIFLIGFMFLMPTGIDGAIRLGWARLRQRISAQCKAAITATDPETIMFVKNLLACAALPLRWPRGRSGRGAEEVRPGRHRHRDQDRPDHALQRPGVGLRHDRQGRGRLLQDDQRAGRHQRPQDQLHLLDDGYSPPKTVEMVRKLVEQDEVLLVFQTLGTPSNTAIQKYMNAKKVPQLFVATGATKWNDPQSNPWTMGWQPNYQTEATIYAKHILKDEAEREDRRALPERRLRQGLPEGPEGRPRRQGEDDDRGRGLVRGDRPDRRLADRAAAGLGRRRVRQHHDAEVRGAGDPQGLRHRLEAGALPEQRLDARSARC